MGFSVHNVKEIIMNENKKVTRRKFLEDSSKKALVGSAAAFLGLGMMKPKAVQAEDCMGGCWFSCTSCTGTCEGGCSFACVGCTGSCSGICTNDCSAECTYECNNIGFACTTPVECGTPVSERETLTRHVTV